MFLHNFLTNHSIHSMLLFQNYNVKNVVVLSEDELCELWQHMKTILSEAQKLCTQASNNKDRCGKVRSFTQVWELLLLAYTSSIIDTGTQPYD